MAQSLVHVPGPRPGRQHQGISLAQARQVREHRRRGSRPAVRFVRAPRRLGRPRVSPDGQRKHQELSQVPVARPVRHVRGLDSHSAPRHCPVPQGQGRSGPRSAVRGGPRPKAACGQHRSALVLEPGLRAEHRGPCACGRRHHAGQRAGGLELRPRRRAGHLGQRRRRDDRHDCGGLGRRLRGQPRPAGRYGERECHPGRRSGRSRELGLDLVLLLP